jgi:hypothetical protein
MRRTAVLVTILVVAVAAAIALAGCGCSDEDLTRPTTNIDLAKDTAAKAGILAIQTGIQAYIATSGAVPSQVNEGTLGSFVQPWPENPWTKAPMAEGTEPGDYTYAPGTGTSYTLTGHLSGGGTYTKP